MFFYLGHCDVVHRSCHRDPSLRRLSSSGRFTISFRKSSEIYSRSLSDYGILFHWRTFHTRRHGDDKTSGDIIFVGIWCLVIRYPLPAGHKTTKTADNESNYIKLSIIRPKSKKIGMKKNPF
jgi:hypothetical protein